MYRFSSIETNMGVPKAKTGVVRPRKSFYKTCFVLTMATIFFGIVLLRPAKQPKIHDGPMEVVRPQDIEGPHRSLLQSADGEWYLPPGWEWDSVCQNIHQLNNTDAQCHFVSNSTYCAMDEGFIFYTSIVYCDAADAKGGVMAGFIIWWIFLFVALAVTADEFFCTALVVIVKTLNLSPNVAGVTFLAFGNGAPDLFSAIAAFLAMKAGDAGLAVGGLFGAGIFVTTMIVGTVALVKPFKVTERPFLRDDIFYLACSYYMFCIIWREKIYLADAIAFVFLYVVYVVIVVVSGSIYKRQQASAQGSGETADLKNPDIEPIKFTSINHHAPLGTSVSEMAKSPTQASITELGNANPGYESDKDVTDEKPDLSAVRKASMDLAAEGNEINLSANGTIDNIVGADDEEEEEWVPDPPLRAFLKHINPINVEEWPDMPIYLKAYEIFKSPATFILTLTIPVVNYDQVPLQNWNRHLQCFQIFFSPILCVILFDMTDAKLGDVFPFWALVGILSLVAAVAIFFLTSNDKRPRFNEGLGYFAFVVAMVWIYVIANEIVNLLTMFGVVLQLSNGVLGITLLAWGNSVGDFVADMVMARQGFPRMAFSACFGAPIFHLLLGTGIPFIARMASDGTNEFGIDIDTMLFMANIAVLLSMAISLVVLLVFKFRANKPYGLILVVFYVAFIIIVILVEAGVIPQDLASHS